MPIPSPQELVFYNEHDILVTSAKIVVRNQTFATRHVTSVRVARVPAKVPVAYYLSVYPALPLFVLAIMAGSLVMGILAAILIVIGFYSAMQHQDMFAVVLVSSAGEQRLVQMDNETTIQQISDAVCKAMTSV